MKGCKAYDDSKSNSKKLYNNIIIYINVLNAKFQWYDLLPSCLLVSEMDKFYPILVSYGITSYSVGFYLSLWIWYNLKNIYIAFLNEMGSAFFFRIYLKSHIHLELLSDDVVCEKTLDFNNKQKLTE